MKTRRNSIIAIALIAIIAVAGLLVHRVAFAQEEAAYRFATVERGDLGATVSATGTLSAVTTVSVGTQVSGQVSEIFVDFNDAVKKGQLLARIDSTLAEQAVADARANLEKARAQAVQAGRDYGRNRELTEAGLVAKSAYEQAQASAEVAQASVKSAQVALERAQQNLAYTYIYAPIDGVVVARNVDEGQTVAASLSAPELFKIANDLAQMQILAQVGESDIAQIRDGQAVEFTVQALPNETFNGTVRQIRLESTTQDNVVNYTVVVAVDNSSGKLLPGMTARAEFLTRSAENVLTVPNAALRFRPSEEQLAELAATRASNTPGSAATPRRAAPVRTRGASGAATLYYLDHAGKLAAMRVRTGISDGSSTEVQGRELKEGMQVITGVTNPDQQVSEGANNPFQSNSQRQRRGPGGF